MSRVVRAKGSRQRIWDTVRQAKSAMTTSQIAGQTGCRRNTAEVYLYGLRKNDYMKIEDSLWTITKDTGPIAPSYTTKSNTIIDLNLNPPMSGARLEKLWRETGLSLNQFAIQLGLGPGMSTRLRAMMNGSKNVGPTIEAAIETHYPPKN